MKQEWSTKSLKILVLNNAILVYINKNVDCLISMWGVKKIADIIS